MTGMERALRYYPPGDWPADQALEHVTLDFDRRHRRRIRLVSDRDKPYLLDLEKAVAMTNGGGLALEGGGWLAVRSAAEPLLEIRARDDAHRTRIAWHLGNRHLPVQICGDALRIRDDHVIADMVRKLDGDVTALDAAFDPEGGAYGVGQVQGHSHGNGNGKGHDHSAAAAPTTDVLYKLLTWVSPSYPIGAYTYSHGLEYAVETGRVSDLTSLFSWLEALIGNGGAWIDAVMLARAWVATNRSDEPKLLEIAIWAAAFRATSETSLEAIAQGRAFADVTCSVWDTPVLGALCERHDGAVTHPVAMGIACAEHKIGLGEALNAYLHGFLANLVSASIRLGVIGQSDGQMAIKMGENVVAETVKRAKEMSDGENFEALGTGTVMADWTSMMHENQYSRLFRS